MPPKAGRGGRASRGGRGASSKSKAAARRTTQSSGGAASESSNPFESSDESQMSDPDAEPTTATMNSSSRSAGRAGTGGGGAGSSGAQEAVEAEKTIPDSLLTRILHEFFGKDATRISRDANAAVGKYVDVFTREAIARAAVEKRGGFLEVEDLEKIAPQLLLDL